MRDSFLLRLQKQPYVERNTLVAHFISKRSLAHTDTTHSFSLDDYSFFYDYFHFLLLLLLLLLWAHNDNDKDR